MNYRGIVRILAKICLLDSIIAFAILVFVVVYGTHYLIKENPFGSIWPIIWILMWVSIFLGGILLQSVRVDLKLFRSTKRGIAPAPAIEGCKSWWKFTYLPLRIRCVFFILSLLREFLCLFDFNLQRWERCEFDGIIFALSQTIMVFLFPIISVLSIYNECWSNKNHFIVCRVSNMIVIIMTVSFRWVTSHYVIKYKARLRQVLFQETLYLMTISGENLIPSLVMQRTPSVRPPVETFVNFESSSGTNEIIMPSAPGENREDTNTINELPSYHDVVRENPPSYNELFLDE